MLSNQGLHQFNVAPSDGSMEKVLPILEGGAGKTNHRNHTHTPVDAYVSLTLPTCVSAYLFYFFIFFVCVYVCVCAFAVVNTSKSTSVCVCVMQLPIGSRCCFCHKFNPGTIEAIFLSVGLHPSTPPYHHTPWGLVCWQSNQITVMATSGYDSWST